MDPITMAIISGIPAVLQAGTGIAQMIGAKKRAGSLGERPETVIPEAVQQSTNIARANASSFMMPGQIQGIENIGNQFANTAYGIGQYATSGNQALAGLIKANETASQQASNMTIAAAQDYAQRQQNLSSQLNIMAGYQQAQNQDRQAQWDANAAAIAAMQQGGMLNTMSGAKGVTGSVLGGMQLADLQKNGYIVYNGQALKSTNNLGANE